MSRDPMRAPDGASALLILLGGEAPPGARERLLPMLQEIAGDARTVAGLDLEGTDPEASPPTDGLERGDA